jgi:Ca-activated chloride channel family protein
MSSLFNNISFVHPWVFLLLVLLPIFYFLKYRYPGYRKSDYTLSNVHGLSKSTSLRSRLAFLIPLLRALCYIALVAALARPQQTLREEEVKAEGIDIMLIMDLSSSMLAKDFSPNRLEVSKKVAVDFVDKRQYDRIGLVVFAGESFTQCPITTDHAILKSFLSNLACGNLEDGTAIGMGLASAVNRLKESEAKSKVVILLTDGVNNAGYIKPMTAAEIAKEIDVKVYTIGVGTLGNAVSPVSKKGNGEYIYGMAKVEIDEVLLQEISKLTGGKYYRATNQEKLEQIYNEINRLEKTEIDVTVFKRYSEEFRMFLYWAFIFIGIELLLKHLIIRKIP